MTPLDEMKEQLVHLNADIGVAEKEFAGTAVRLSIYRQWHVWLSALIKAAEQADRNMVIGREHVAGGAAESEPDAVAVPAAAYAHPDFIDVKGVRFSLVAHNYVSGFGEWRAGALTLIRSAAGYWHAKVDGVPKSSAMASQRDQFAAVNASQLASEAFNSKFILERERQAVKL